jgi:hypothetical protein
MQKQVAHLRMRHDQAIVHHMKKILYRDLLDPLRLKCLKE